MHFFKIKINVKAAELRIEGQVDIFIERFY